MQVILNLINLKLILGFLAINKPTNQQTNKPTNQQRLFFQIINIFGFLKNKILLDSVFWIF
jgi:hypothetical protein